MSFLDYLMSIFTNPVSLMQAGVITAASVLLFLLLFTLRDILLRTRSFLYQFFCVLLVGALPILGFLVYLLIRPARTLKQRETDSMLRRILGEEPEGEMLEIEELETIVQENSAESIEEQEEKEDDPIATKPISPIV